MRKKIFKNVLGVAMIGVLFTSCLGDSETKIGRTGDYVYIDVNEENGRKYGRTFMDGATYFFYSSEIDDRLEQDDYVIMSYKLSSDDMTSDNFFNAKNVDFTSSDIYNFRNGRQVMATYVAQGDTTYTETDQIFIDDGGSSRLSYYYVTTAYFADKWLMKFYYYRYENESVSPQIEVVYNANLQGENPAANDKIIDIRLRRQGTGSGEQKLASMQRVIDFSNLRQAFDADKVDNKINLKFRYRRYQDSNYNTYKMHTTVNNDYLLYVDTGDN